MADRPERLDVTMHDMVIAYLREKSERGPIELIHTEEALERWRRRSPVVSCSVPVSERPQDATPFLEGLLPEGHARNTLAAQRDLLASDTWGLLASFGRDIAGAMVIREPTANTARRTPDAETYDSPEQLATDIVALPEHPLGVHDDSELSLAGLQDKLLLVKVDEGIGWARPTGGLPSTHICKPDPLRHPGVVQREAEALRLAKAVGLTTIEPQLLEIDDRPCLIVDRYDRTRGEDGTISRIHQEDLCQATGTNPREKQGRIKYQEGGGPGFADAARLLLERSPDPERELRLLAGAMVFTVLIGNSDAHAKNLSLLLDPPGAVRLAPLYDTVPTMLFDKLGVRCAMWIGGVYRSLEEVTHKAMVREIAGRHAWKVPEAEAEGIINDWLDRITIAADTETPTGRYVRRRAARL